MKRVLVTGGAGFIGSHLVDRLVREKYQVIVFDNLTTGKDKYISKNIQLVIGDARRKKDVKKLFQNYQFEAVFHIAGQASAITSFTSPYFDIETNFLATVNIALACLEHKIPRLLYASSMTVYGNPKGLPITENQACKPISYYGISKYAAERFLQATAQRSDLNFPFHVTSLRMFNVYGPRQSLTNPYQGPLAIFVGNVLRNEPIRIYGDGKQTRDFVYVEDVTRAWLLALDNPQTYGADINIGLGQSTSLVNLAKMIIKALGKSPQDYPIEYFPARPGDQRFMKADNSLLFKTLGFKPKTSLKTGLEKTISWAKNAYLYNLVHTATK